MDVIWKDIFGFDSKYQISNTGDVLSFYGKIPRVLKIKDNGSGYKLVSFRIKSKPVNHYIHRLVATTFIPNPDNKPQINHKDGNKANNNVLNLEWCSQSENNIHAYYNGLRIPTGSCAYGRIDPKRKAVLKCNLDGIVIEEFKSIMHAANNINVSSSRISRACNPKCNNKIVHGFTYKFA